MNTLFLKCYVICILCAISLTTYAASTSPLLLQPAFKSVKMFGAQGDGKADDTKALQAALDQGEVIVLPKGIYRTTATLFIRTDNVALFGYGPSATIIQYEGSGTAIASFTSLNKTFYWCRLLGIRIDATNPNQAGPLINWSSMQFGSLENLWIKGSGSHYSVGILLAATPKKTEATYNVISHSYIGSVQTGIEFKYGANSNTIENSRIQPIAGGVGILMHGQMSNNHIINTGFEYPGNVSGGILIESNVHNTLIQGNRFESLAYGWKVTGSSNTNTVALGNYYDSISKNAYWINQGMLTQNLDQIAAPSH